MRYTDCETSPTPELFFKYTVDQPNPIARQACNGDCPHPGCRTTPRAALRGGREHRRGLAAKSCVPIYRPLELVLGS